MAQRDATVHLLCGLNGSGKTTLARQLAEDLPAVRFTLDEWMLRLYGLRYDDPAYVEHLDPAQDLIWETAQQVLGLGRDVVLDWNQWSRERRAKWRGRAEDFGARVVIHYVDVPVDVAVDRMMKRNDQAAEGTHEINESGVRHLAAIFEPPSAEEGIEVLRHS